MKRFQTIENTTNELGIVSKTTVNMPTEGIFAKIKRTVVFNNGDDNWEREVEIQNEEIGIALFNMLRERLGDGWRDMTIKPEQGEFVFVKKDGAVNNISMYLSGEDWFFWTGEKATALFAKQITHWKYQSEI